MHGVTKVRLNLFKPYEPDIKEVNIPFTLLSLFSLGGRSFLPGQARPALPATPISSSIDTFPSTQPPPPKDRKKKFIERQQSKSILFEPFFFNKKNKHVGFYPDNMQTFAACLFRYVILFHIV